MIDSGINTQAAELRGANITVKDRWCADEDGYAPPADTTDPELSLHRTGVVAMLVGNGVAGDGGPGTHGVVPDAQVWFYGGLVPRDEDGWDCAVARPPAGVEVDEEFPLPVSLLRTLDGPGEDDPEEWAKWNSPYVKESNWDPNSMAALDAIRSGADIVSVSMTSPGFWSWGAVLAEAIREGVVVVAAIPNPGQGLGAEGAGFGVPVPASLNGAVAVNAFDREAGVSRGEGGEAEGSRNLAFGAPGVDILLPGSSFAEPGVYGGTSYATPLVAGVIALGLQKHPDATAHQVLQAMVHTTGARDFGDAQWQDEWMGYGLINPRAMLEVDIPQMPDENPLFVTHPDDPRCRFEDDPAPTSIEDCWAWATMPEAADVWPDEYSDDPEQAPEEPGDGDEGGNGDVEAVDPGPEAAEDSGLSVGLVVGIGIAGLLVVVGIAVFAARRK